MCSGQWNRYDTSRRDVVGMHVMAPGTIPLAIHLRFSERCRSFAWQKVGLHFTTTNFEDWCLKHRHSDSVKHRWTVMWNIGGVVSKWWLCIPVRKLSCLVSLTLYVLTVTQHTATQNIKMKIFLLFCEAGRSATFLTLEERCKKPRCLNKNMFPTSREPTNTHIEEAEHPLVIGQPCW